MSYSLSVCSPDPQLISKAEIQTEMGWKGWSIAFASGRHGDTLLSVQGPIEDGMFVYGWKSTDASAHDFTRLLAEGNTNEFLSRLQTDYVVDSCTISVNASYDISQDYDEDELEDFDDEYIEALRQAKCAYEIGSGKRGSISFTRDVWRAIGGKVGGLLDDLHEGNHEIMSGSRPIQR